MYLSAERCKKIILWVILFFIFLFFTKKLFVLLFPLFSSFFVALSLQKPINSLYSSFKIPRKVSSFILVSLLILVFLFSSFLIIKKVQSELISFSEFNFEWSFLSKYLSLIIDKALAFFSSLGEFFPKLLIFVTVFIFSSFYIASEYDKIEETFIFVKKFKKVFSRIASGYIKSYFILFLFTFAFLYLALTIIKIKFSFVIALVIAILDIFPILSAGVLIMPWAFFELFAGSRSLALILVLIALFLTVIKKFIEPKILGGFVGLHPLISLVSISVGYLFMGMTGAFIFPFVLSIILELKKEM